MAVIEKVCTECGEGFYARATNIHACSEACSYKRRRRTDLEKRERRRERNAIEEKNGLKNTRKEKVDPMLGTKSVEFSGVPIYHRATKKKEYEFKKHKAISDNDLLKLHLEKIGLKPGVQSVNFPDVPESFEDGRTYETRLGGY